MTTWLKKLLNWSPVFHCSQDQNFGSIGDGVNLRYSLLVVPIGKKKLYLFSINERKFSCLYQLLAPISNELEYFQDLKNKYLEHLETLPSEAVETEIDTLKDKLSTCRGIYSQLLSKSSMYIGILSIYVAPVILLLSEAISRAIESDNFFYQGIVVYITISIVFWLMNFSLFNLEALRVKGTYASTFGEIKASPDRNTLASLYYFDWQSEKSRSENLATIIKNVEKYLGRSLVGGFTLGATIIFGHYLSSGVRESVHLLNKDGSVPIKTVEQISNLYTSSDSVINCLYNGSNESAKKLAQLVSNILEEKVECTELSEGILATDFYLERATK